MAHAHVAKFVAVGALAIVALGAAEASAAAGAGSGPEQAMDMRLYLQEDTPPLDDGSAFPHRKRWKKVYRQHSGLQLVEVLEDAIRGSTSLFLDRALQLTTLGEHMYHEMMAYVPLGTVEQPRNVLIIGAGDGGVALRVLRHPDVVKVVQVELDEAVVNVSRRYFPELAKAFDDPRMELYLQDAIAWAISRAQGGEKDVFDACIIDSTDDPLGGPWTTAFFSALHTLLKPSAVLIQNAQSLDVPAQLERLLRLHQAGGFSYVRPVLISTIDYGSPYIAFLSSGLEGPARCGVITREDDEFEVQLASSWYSPSIHRASLALPPAMLKRWPEFRGDGQGCLFPPTADALARAGGGHDERGTRSKAKIAEKARLATDGVEVFDFVIVGGGMAGIAAAHALSLHAVGADVLVLEGRDRVGGRIETTDPASFGGVAANLGANWIHFAEKNPVLELAKRLECPTYESRNGNLKWSAEGLGALPESAVDDARDFAADLSAAMDSSIAKPRLGLSAAEHLASVAKKMPQRGRGASDLSEGAREAARHLHFFCDVVQDHTARLRDLSSTRLCHNSAGGDPVGADVVIGGGNGTACLLTGLINEASSDGKVRFRTGHAVLELRALGNAAAASDPISRTSGVEILVAVGKARQYRVRARAVVVAVPLGVLQASVGSSCSAEDAGGACSATNNFREEGLIKFEPLVPKALAAGWRRRGVGQSLRAAMLFAEVFWDPSVEYFGHLVDFDAADRRPLEFYGDAPAVELTNALNFTGRPVLLVEVNRVLADRLEGLSDGEIADFLLQQVRVIFSFATVPSPLSVAVKRFGSDPFLRGALSFAAVTEEAVTSAELVDLWAPLWGGRLLFAGEHTSPAHGGTLDGALLSGIEAAWCAACYVGDAENVHRPVELVQALGIFSGWFSDAESQSCVHRVSASLVPRRGQAGNCRTQWLDELERRCRVFAVESRTPEQSNRRHCLDQGD